MLRRNPPDIIEVSEEILPWEQEPETDIESAAPGAEPTDAPPQALREDAPWPGPAPRDPTAPVLLEEHGVPIMPTPQPGASLAPTVPVVREDVPPPAVPELEAADAVPADEPAVPEWEAAATPSPADERAPRRVAAAARLARVARQPRRAPRRALAGCALLAAGVGAVLLTNAPPDDRPQEPQRAAATATPRAPTVTEPPAEPDGPDPGTERRRAARARAAAERVVEQAQRRAEQAQRRAERRAQERREQRDDSDPAPSGASPAPAAPESAPTVPAPTEPAPAPTAPDPAEREFGLGP